MQNQCSKMKTPACQGIAEKRDTGHARLVLVGINYKTSSLEEREPLQFEREELPRVDDLLISTAGVMEAVSICTCNRIEFYLVLRDTVSVFGVVAEMYRKFRDVDVSVLREKFYERTEAHAARHMLRVAAGLDSMVLGETQIFGQIKEGYSLACSVKSAGKILHRLFHQAFRTGKRVREQTTIGRSAVSVGGVAARVARERLSENPNPAILFVGANEMISLAAEHLRKAGYHRFVFANRTLEHAGKLADAFGGESFSLDDLGRRIGSADAVVVCTGAATPVVTRAMIEKAFAAVPDGKQLLIMDLGVPRDVQEEVGELAGVSLLDLDDLHQELNSGLAERATAIGPAEEIVEATLSQFLYWYEAVRLEPIYNGLGEAFEKIRAEELAGIGDECSPECREAVDRFSIRLMRRLLQAACRRSE